MWASYVADSGYDGSLVTAFAFGDSAELADFPALRGLERRSSRCRPFSSNHPHGGDVSGRLVLPATDAVEVGAFAEAVQLQLPHGLECLNDHGRRPGHGQSLSVPRDVHQSRTALLLVSSGTTKRCGYPPRSRRNRS